MSKNEPTEIVVEETKTNTKREITAVVASTTVTVVLGVASQLLVSKIAGRVHNAIAPQNETE